MVNDTPITLVGWLGTDPQISTVGEGHRLATFRVASRSRRQREGVWEDGPTSWFSVKAWGRLAEHCAASLASAQPVLVHGRLVAEVWRRDDGSTASRYVVVASSVGHDLTHGTAAFSSARASPGPSGAIDAAGRNAAGEAAEEAAGEEEAA